MERQSTAPVKRSQLPSKAQAWKKISTAEIHH
jgi:hypothetical protein